ncbi:MAG: 1,2-phenylacetyl-CoA epoxidase subunit PaaD [Jatrophihabitantaceae bacterium]
MRIRSEPRTIAQAVTDPELPMLTLHDLGVLRDVRTDGERVVVEITPTYSGCPAVAEMRADLTRRLHEAGYEADVRIVLSPPWSSDDITEHGRRVLAEHGIAPPGPAPRRAAGPVPITLGVPPARVDCPQCGSSDTVEISRFGSTACKALHRCRHCAEPFEHLKAI